MRSTALAALLFSALAGTACVFGGEENPTQPAPATGTLQVAASTSGEDVDPDGYTVTVDGSQSASMGINAAPTFTGLSGGDHVVELRDVRDNCSTLGANPKTVTVPAGASASVTFTVECRARTGGVEVTASTSGDDVDPDGYRVTVDGSRSRPVAANGSTTFTDLDEGRHRLELSAVRENCTVSGENPWTVSVAFDSTTSTAVNVECRARTGGLEVSASTSGDDVDSDGYTVTVDGSRSKSVGPEGSTTFADLDEGEHEVELRGLRSNCSVEGENPRTATVPFDSTAAASFSVSCVSRTGTLEVTASTSGEDADADGYTAVVDGSDSASVAPDGSATFTGLSEGEHRVELSGVRGNCSVEGENPRTAAVDFGSTTTASFSVECDARTGALEVTASTSGEEQDTDGYTAVVDGSRSEPVGPDGSVTFEDLAEGDHRVELTDVRGNCAVEGENPRSATVEFGSTATASFSVTCEASGALEVTASTSGEDADSDGYTVTVDGTRSDSIGPEGSAAFGDLAGGDHEVELSGIRDNCAAEGANPRTVRVPAGGTASTAFSVDCVARTGRLEVTSSTSGEDVDSDGYTVTVDDARSDSIGANGTTAFTELAEGTHDVELGDVQGNCAVAGENPRTVEVAFDSTSSTDFSVDCEMADGTLEVSAITRGDTTDPDGYTVTVDGERERFIEPSGTTTFSNLTAGDHTVELGGVQANCGTAEENPRTVSVTSREATTVSFTVDCEPAFFDRVVFVSTRLAADPELFSVAVGGSVPIKLTDDPGEPWVPHVSPDGTRITYVSNRSGNFEVYVLRLDGSEPTRITNNAKRDWRPRWSPDGERILFERDDRVGQANIYLVDPDGDNLTAVTETSSDDRQPTWGPDGETIYFASDRDGGDDEIYRMNRDGSGVEQLTRNRVEDFSPAVSPDGSRIAFVRVGGRGGSDSEILTMTADGDDFRRLTDNEATDSYPQYSPDGEWILFWRGLFDGNDEIFRMRPDGSELTNVTDHPEKDFFGVFTPMR